MPDYAYMSGALFWLAVWALLFAILKKQRTTMVVVGALLSVAGPVSEYWSLRDYWHPGYLCPFIVGGIHFGGLEDLILTFALAGGCAGVFEAVATRLGWEPLPPLHWRTVVRVWLLGLCGIAGFFLLTAVTTWNSIHVLLATVTVVAVVMQTVQPSCARLTLALSLAAGVAYQLFYVLIFVPLYPGVFEAWWNLSATWPIRWAGVPLEETAWAAVTMAFAGPLLRVCSRNRSSE
ncbi:MAG: hypothetical protein JNM99_18985 [Verrucomicrobiaceae bacterium]|nr:hypothetical protein [Verrucomicrobiaceae bacterium]